MVYYDSTKSIKKGIVTLIHNTNHQRVGNRNVIDFSDTIIIFLSKLEDFTEEPEEEGCPVTDDPVSPIGIRFLLKPSKLNNGRQVEIYLHICLRNTL